MLVDGEGVEWRGVECFAGVTHGGGESRELVRVESALEDGHEESGDLRIGDELFVWRAGNDVVNEGCDLSVAEGEAVAFVKDDVDGMNGLGHGFNVQCDYDLSGYELVRKKAAGSRAAMVVSAIVPPSAGKKTMVSGVLNSWMV